MDKPIYLGFAVLELSKLCVYVTFYDKLPLYFGDEISQLHYIDRDAIVLSLNTKDVIKDLKNLENLFNFSNLQENHEIFSYQIKKVIWNFKTEIPRNIWVDDFVCLRSQMYSFKCGIEKKI